MKIEMCLTPRWTSPATNRTSQSFILSFSSPYYGSEEEAKSLRGKNWRVSCNEKLAAKTVDVRFSPFNKEEGYRKVGKVVEETLASFYGKK